MSWRYGAGRSINISFYLGKLAKHRVTAFFVGALTHTIEIIVIKNSLLQNNSVKVEGTSVFKRRLRLRKSPLSVIAHSTSSHPIYSANDTTMDFLVSDLSERNPGHGWTAGEANIDPSRLFAPEPVPLNVTKDACIKGILDQLNISEAAHSGDFTFPPREPPPSGQFGNNPLAKSLNAQLPEACQNGTTDPLGRALPLNLPELGLSGKLHADTSSAPGHSSNAEASHQSRFVGSISFLSISRVFYCKTQDLIVCRNPGFSHLLTIVIPRT